MVLKYYQNIKEMGFYNKCAMVFCINEKKEPQLKLMPKEGKREAKKNATVLYTTLKVI